MLLPKSCVLCEFPVAVKEEAQFVRRGSHVVLDEADKSLHQESVCLSCKQMALGCVQSAVVFPRCWGWDNHGQQGAELHPGERQCGEIRVAGTGSQVALDGRFWSNV